MGVEMGTVAPAGRDAVAARPGDCRVLLDALRGAPAPAPRAEDVVAEAARLGCDLGGGASAVCVRARPEDATWVLVTIAQESPAALVARRGDRIEALVPPAGDALQLARRLQRRVPAGVAPLETDVARLGRGLRFAELALELAKREQLELDDLLTGTWRVLLTLAATDEREIDAFVAATVGPAADHAPGSRTELLFTLCTYLAHGARIIQTSKAMHHHRHTIGYRLGRIHELTGHDPQTSAGRVQLSVGLQALAIRAALNATRSA